MTLFENLHISVNYLLQMNDYQIKVLNKYFCDIKFLKVREGELEKWGDTRYGIPYNAAIELIANYRTCKMFEETTLAEFLPEWKKQLDIANKEIKELTKNLKV